MTRPKRRRIIPRTAARASRKVAVRLTATTSSQASSRQLHQQIVSCDPGIGHQDIELAHRFLGLGHQGLDRILVGEVAGNT